MALDNNPFEYEAANNLTDEMIADYYIDDFNYSRFIQSKRNIFLVGERGSGKTMALLYNCWRLRQLLAKRDGDEPSLSKIGVYIPCNTPLTHKTEYQLLDDFLGAVLSEHFLILSITYALAGTLDEIPGILEGADETLLRSETSFVLGAQLPQGVDYFDAVKQFLSRELLTTQRAINKGLKKPFYDNTFSFASVFVPMLNICANKIPSLKKTHFLLLIDDAHVLNIHQIRVLNSWVSYRDHSLFSFKIAVAKISPHTKTTSTGGTILEGHDYTQIDLEAPYQNRDSSFYKLAWTVIKRRLENMSVQTTPEDYFPVSTSMEKDLDTAKQTVRLKAIAKYGEADKKARKAVSDYVYKYARAHYFRNRPAKANRPPYSGFETIVYLSTGVIRNLLEPCFWMFDSMVSESKGDQGVKLIDRIPSAIQTRVILERSKRTWEWLRDNLAEDIYDCSMEDGQRAYRLLDALAIHFRERLHSHHSEPRALSFTISSRNDEATVKLDRIIEILRKAQLLYIRTGPAKDDGKREVYYVPNRILWPDRGLDPHGQHARVSLPVPVLWNAADTGRIDLLSDDPGNKQKGLWIEGVTE